MKHIVCIIAVMLFTLVSQAAWAAKSDQVSAQESTAQLLATIDTDNERTLKGVVTFTLSDDWKMYWRTSGESGFAPMFDWSSSTNLENIQLQWPYPTRQIDDLGNDLILESFVYQKAVSFPFTASIIDPLQTSELSVSVDYGVCKDICIPEHVELALNLQPDASDANVEQSYETALTFIPSEPSEHNLSFKEATLSRFDGQDNGTLSVNVIAETALPAANTDLFVESSNPDIIFKKPQIIPLQDEGLRFTYALTDVADLQDTSHISFTLVTKTNDDTIAVEHHMPMEEVSTETIPNNNAPISETHVPESTPPNTIPLSLMILFAFIGGLILNVMPCVLPVLSIKVLGVLKHGNDGSTSSHVRFVFLAAAAGILTSFIFLALSVIFLQSVGMSVGWGFHFQQPAFIITLILILALFAYNLYGLFEIALPRWIGSFGATSSKQNLISHFMTGVLATILATPCTAPFLGTAVGFALSQNAAIILLAFIAMGTGMATPYLLLSFAPSTVRFLPKPGAWMITFKKIMAFCVLGTAIYLIYVLSSQMGLMSAAAISAICVLILITLITKNNLSRLNPGIANVSVVLLVLIGFYLPYHYSVGAYIPANSSQGNVTWHTFDENKIAKHITNGKVVFVDITADWCLTCKANKFLVLDRESVQTLFSNETIITMRGDITTPNPAIFSFMQSHGRSGIPLNIVYGPSKPNGIILSELLSVDKVKDAIAAAR